MQLISAELITIRLPLVSPFTTSFSTQTVRTPMLLRATFATSHGPVTGWGECVTLDGPWYSPEYSDAAAEVIRHFLIPAVLDWQRKIGEITAEVFGHVVAHVVGHRMAKAALEMAILDAQLRLHECSLASYFGAVRDTVPSGVSVGIQSSVDELLGVVGEYLDEGYLRIKLKIRPGWDVEPVRAVRERFGDIPLQVDANAAYTLADVAQLSRLDPFGLLLVEQPLAADDMYQHARLAEQIRTPVCLDESVESVADAAAAIAMGAAAVINIKPGRVGGYLEARRIHDLARAHGVAVWCGGMIESGIGRSANIALASMPGFTLPGDVSASNRFFVRDVTAPVVLDNGQVAVPRDPGIGVDPDPDLLAEFATRTERLVP